MQMKKSGLGLSMTLGLWLKSFLSKKLEPVPTHLYFSEVESHFVPKDFVPKTKRFFASIVSNPFLLSIKSRFCDDPQPPKIVKKFDVPSDHEKRAEQSGLFRKFVNQRDSKYFSYLKKRMHL
jgi:hypothetical protein